MGEPYMGELRIFPYSYAPKGWAACDGQLLPINQNQALFSLLGTNFGGNGTTNFALPDLRGRVPMHVFPATSSPGQRGGESTHTLSVAELPAHRHALTVTQTVGDQVLPGNNLLANANLNLYAPFGAAQPLAADSVTNVGGSQPHENMAPYLTLTICIALQGVFPSTS